VASLTITAMENPRSWDEVAADLVVDVSLFLCSYAPLFAILAIRFRTTWLEIACAALAALGLAAGLAVIARGEAAVAPGQRQAADPERFIRRFFRDG
jgi:hypothetical protein